MKEKRRRLTLAVAVALLASVYFILQTQNGSVYKLDSNTLKDPPVNAVKATNALGRLEIKGRAPKTDYARSKFLSDWASFDGCDMRNFILARDMTDAFIDPSSSCTVKSGVLDDPYTGKTIAFKRGQGTSQSVQIDHVVALSDAWQKGAQQLEDEERNLFGNDPLNLLAVDGPTNQNKSDGDAATWLPPNKGYRCRYVARQIAVKVKYRLWVTLAEKDTIRKQLRFCPDQTLPVEGDSS